MYDCTCTRMYYVSTHNNIVYFHITLYCASERIFLIFISWFLEAP